MLITMRISAAILILILILIHGRRCVRSCNSNFHSAKRWKVNLKRLPDPPRDHETNKTHQALGHLARCGKIRIKKKDKKIWIRGRRCGRPAVCWTVWQESLLCCYAEHCTLQSVLYTLHCISIYHICTKIYYLWAAAAEADPTGCPAESDLYRGGGADYHTLRQCNAMYYHTLQCTDFHTRQCTDYMYTEGSVVGSSRWIIFRGLLCALDRVHWLHFGWQ